MLFTHRLCAERNSCLCGSASGCAGSSQPNVEVRCTSTASINTNSRATLVIGPSRKDVPGGVLRSVSQIFGIRIAASPRDETSRTRLVESE